MARARPHAVVYTDLDGTLLDHHDYRWDAATPALAALAEQGIPVVAVTSKTVAEMQPLRQALGLTAWPFAAENGGVLGVPAGLFGSDRGEPLTDALFVEPIGPAYGDIVAKLAGLRAEGFGFIGFADMDTAAIARATGLTEDEAKKARQRLCSEPLLWQDDADALARFRQRVAASGLTLRAGGRFLHVLGHCDKGQALRCLQARFAGSAKPPAALAIGDSDNDLDLLAAADRGILVARPDGSYAAPADGPKRLHAGAVGPAGWNAAIMAWLQDIG